MENINVTKLTDNQISVLLSKLKTEKTRREEENFDKKVEAFILAFNDLQKSFPFSECYLSIEYGVEGINLMDRTICKENFSL